MLRKPAFWVVAVAACALATWFSIVGFPLAFPLVTLDLRMDRAGALEAAQGLAEEHGWGPEDFRQAAMFDRDGQVQAFVELEAGGNEGFARMLDEGLYHPYRWRVRHFQPQEPTETFVTFTPAGEPLGFRERLPEDQEGAALEVDAARAIAERGAAGWQVDLSEYEAVETSREVRPSERVDHSFVYERPEPRLGEGRYRLRLVVSGERFTELTHFVQVPEAFGRRYAEMRSSNDAIAAGGSVVIVLVLLIGGCGVGLFFLLRARWVTWRQALVWGLVVGGLEAAAYVNFWPLLWMEYDTAVSATNFTLQQLAMAFVQFLVIAGITTLVFMAAESLTRRAFPEQLQIWKLWSPGVANSRAVLGGTIAGFLLVAAFAAYEVALYFLARRTLGWWNPSDALSNPNLLAGYFPWLTAVAISLRAGVTEECLFRAVPLASAALLGRRFGGQRWWILGTLLLQAVLFGAAHANYPAQPAYARLVELILPALGWGVLYLTFGLLPCIVCHFAVDVVFIGLPIITSSAPGAWLHSAIMVLLTLVPLWVVLAARYRRGRWEEPGEEAYNRAWSPPAVVEQELEPQPVAASLGLDPRVRTALLALGFVGLVAWGATGRFTSDAPPVDAGRAQATASARAALETRGIQLGDEWRELSVVEGGADLVDRFVWQEGGADTYREILGTYVWVPSWRVRYARFEGDVAERAEEYVVWTDGQGQVTRFMHRRPEARPGASLEEEAAREHARTFLRETHGVDPEAVEEVSAEPQQRPERRDWRFVFRNPAVDPGGGGEARVTIDVAGDEIADSFLWVHVPEEWRRQETDRESGVRIVNIASAILVFLVFGAGSVLGIVRWSRGRFATRAFFTFFGLLAVLNVAAFLNMWPATTAGFVTEVPFKLQVGMVLAGASLALLVTAAALALNVGLAHRWLPPSAAAPPITMGALAGLGAALAGLDALLTRFAPNTSPYWASAAGANAFLPWLAALLDPVSDWVTTTALMLVVIAALHAGTAGWSRRRVPFAVLAILLGLALTGGGGVASYWTWLAGGVMTGAVVVVAYALVFRHHAALLPLATAVAAALGAAATGLVGAFPGVLAGSILGAVTVLILGCLWSRALASGSGGSGRVS